MLSNLMLPNDYPDMKLSNELVTTMTIATMANMNFERIDFIM